MTNLYRSRTDRMLLGVCGGFAKRYTFDPTLLRVVLAVGCLFSAGTLLLIYLICAAVMPKEPEYIGSYRAGEPGWNHWDGGAASGASGAYGGKMHHVSQTDAMMDDLEKAQLRRELDHYRAKVAQYEKGE